MNAHDHDKAVQRIEDLRRDYCPEDDPEWSEREAAREARERYEASEPWKEWFRCPGCGGRAHNDVGRATDGTCPECCEGADDG